MLIVELSMSPLGEKQSVSEDVAKVIDIIDRSGLNYKLGPMGTCIEGEWDEVMGTVKKCFEAQKKDSKRIVFSIKADWRDINESRLNQKVKKIETILDRKLRI